MRSMWSSLKGWQKALSVIAAAIVVLVVIGALSGHKTQAKNTDAAKAVTTAPATTAPAISAPASTSAPDLTDPNGEQCTTLDSLGYCPGDDPSPTPAAVSCGDQVKAWLAEQDGSSISGNTVQHDITAIIFDAKSYQAFAASDPAAGQNFLNFINTFVTNLTYTATPNAPPTCADPQDLWGGDTLTSGTFLGDASNASNDTSGTGQAANDVQAILNDFSALNAELAQNSGVKAKGYAGTP